MERARANFVRCQAALWALLFFMALPTLRVLADENVNNPDDDPSTAPRLFLEPIAGLTTTRHLAPSQTAIPLGTILELFLEVPGDAQVSFSGATVTSRTSEGISATCLLDRVGPVIVAAISELSDGTRHMSACRLEVVSIAIGDISATVTTPTVAHFDLDEHATNEDTMSSFFAGSIAELAETTTLVNGAVALDGGRSRPRPVSAIRQFRTSTFRQVTFHTSIDPPSFAPLMEWRIDGLVRALGAELKETFTTVGAHTVSFGPPDRPIGAVVDTYSVSITSHESGGSSVPQGEWITFEAVTDPPGWENEINWMSSTKYGIATPVVGHGPTFRVRFLDAYGGHADGGLFEWLGVRADNATVNQDQKFDQVRLYTMSAPDVTGAYACAIATTKFGMTCSNPEVDPQSIIVSDGDESLVVYIATGAFEYQDNSALWNPAYSGPPAEMTADGAITFATNFLTTQNLLPSEAQAVASILIDAKNDDGSTVPNHWRIFFEFKLDIREGLGSPFPVNVIGATIEARVGNNEMIGLYWYWREVTPGEALPVLDTDTVLAMASLRPSFFPYDPLSFGLEYQFFAETVPQTLLAPSLRILLAGPGHEGSASVPATAKSPFVTINDPGDDSKPACTEFSIGAMVQGGTPPYSFVWLDPNESVRRLVAGLTTFDGTVGVTNPAIISLEGGVHTISVIVTDSLGMEASDTWVIRVDPGTCGTVTQWGVDCPPPDDQPTLRKRINSHGWSMVAEITDDDGLVLNHVSFRSNQLAFKMDLPFYDMATERMDLPNSIQHCELKYPPDTDINANCRSFLIGNGIFFDASDTGFLVGACYCVTDIPNQDPATGRMLACQAFGFWRVGTGCSPGDAYECVRYKPYFAWIYDEPPAPLASNEFIIMSANQRMDFDVGSIGNVGGLFKDPDTPFSWPIPIPIVPQPANERITTVANLDSPAPHDNYHQKNGYPVIPSLTIYIPGCSGLPFSSPGYWDCAHQHWRWSKLLGKKWGSGKTLVPSPPQLVDIWVLLYEPNPDPPDFNLFNYLDDEPIGSDSHPRHDLTLWVSTHSQTEFGLTNTGHWFFR